jgi:methylphosphotriester-DNA--protein-cysteine methyltransferase
MDPLPKSAAHRSSRSDQEAIGVGCRACKRAYTMRKSCASNAGLVEKAAGEVLHLARASKD